MRRRIKRKRLAELFEANNFKVYQFQQDGKHHAELETWTDGGVNMIITLMPFTAKSFLSYVKDFDVDELIDLYRQDPGYRNAFTIAQSLKDFRRFHKRLKCLKKELKLIKMIDT